MSERLKVVDVSDVGQSHEFEPDEPALAPDQAGPGKSITLHFALELEDGRVVDSNFEGKAASCQFGDGSLPPRFEHCLRGLRAGDTGQWWIHAEEAFGPVNEDNIQKFPRHQFPADLMLEKGLMVSFADSAGNEQAGTVVELDTDNKTVTIDFNHPLAGRDVLFRAALVDVQQA